MSSGGNLPPRVQLAIHEGLGMIASQFHEGVRLTLIVRNPDVPNGAGDLLITQEDELGPLIVSLGTSFSAMHRRGSVERPLVVPA